MSLSQSRMLQHERRRTLLNRDSRFSSIAAAFLILAASSKSFCLRIKATAQSMESRLKTSQEAPRIDTGDHQGENIRSFLDLSSSSRGSSFSTSSASSFSSSSSSSSSSIWNLSRISSTRQLDAWRDRVAACWAQRALPEAEEKPVRVFVSHGRWMTRTSAPSTLQPDGSFVISDCSVPCAVEFNKDERRGEQPVPYPATFDWTRWTTSPSVRAADVVMQIDRPWDARQLRQLRALYHHKRAVFASWEPLGDAHRTAEALSDRHYDWLASFTFSGETAADVPSTYEGLDHSDIAVAAYYKKRRKREIESANGHPSRNHSKKVSVEARTAGRKRTGAAVSTHAALTTIKSSDIFSNAKEKKNSSFCRGATSPVFMAVSNCASEQRQRLLSAFMEVLPVDSYGNCLHNSKLSSDLLPGCADLQSKDWREQKDCMMSCYPFVLSIESRHSEVDYATEKLFDPLMHDSVVPIYLGPPNEREFLPHPSAALLVRDFSAEGGGAAVDDETMRRVARHVASISQNATAMQQLQSWRKELDDQGFRGESGQNKNSKEIDTFPFQLRTWFSYRRFFCNLCTRYAAERLGIVVYDDG